MESFIEQLVKLAGLPDDLARDVLETARELLAQKMTPEQLQRVDALLADEKKAARAGKLAAKLARKIPTDRES